MDPIFLYFIIGGLAGGFLCGLSGFGAGLVTLPIVLFVGSPLLAAQLAALAGIASQIQAIRAVRYGLHWRQLLPIVLAGIVGIAAALWLIPPLPIDLFKFCVGCILIGYSLFALAVPGTWRFARRHPTGNLAAGLLGGLAGGIAGIPGPPVIMWAALQSWSAEEKRSLIQIFNLVTLSVMLALSAARGRLDDDFIWAGATMLPAIIAGAFLGVAAYRRLNDHRYQQLVIVLLLIAGITMVMPN